MDPELTINFEVNEMNVDKTEKVDKIKDEDTRAEEEERGKNGDMMSKTEDGGRQVNKTVSEVDSIDSLDNSDNLNTDSTITQPPEEVVKNTQTDTIPTKKASVEKKSSKLKIWFLRTFFFKKYNKSKINFKQERHNLTVTESGVESTPPTPSLSSEIITPISDSVPEEKLEQPILCTPVSVVTERITDRGISE